MDPELALVFALTTSSPLHISKHQARCRVRLVVRQRQYQVLSDVQRLPQSPLRIPDLLEQSSSRLRTPSHLSPHMLHFQERRRRVAYCNFKYGTTRRASIWTGRATQVDRLEGLEVVLEVQSRHISEYYKYHTYIVALPPASYSSPSPAGTIIPRYISCPCSSSGY